MKTIALFGGSFNPPHPGHFETASFMQQTLGVDEVWFLFSMNAFKDPASYASSAHRIAMGELLAKHYPGKSFVMSDIEETIGSHRTFDVLNGIKAKFPNDKFIWTMGADNLENFHLWENYDQIIDMVPIAILDRPGFTDRAKNAVTARTYPHLNIANAGNLASSDKGWCFLNNQPLDMSSTILRSRIDAGERRFTGPVQEIVDYILKHGLYNTGKAATQAPQP